MAARAKRSSKRSGGSGREPSGSRSRGEGGEGGSGSGSEPKGTDVWSTLLRETEAADNASGAPKPAPAAGAGAGTEGDGATEGEGAASNAPVVTEKGTESFVLFVGPKQSGKSTLIVQFLNPNKDDTPKPTVALEYTFGRRSNTASTVKDIAHLWELGGGTHLSELLSVPITPQRLPHACVVVVVDMSKPGNVIDELMTWIKLIKERVSECTDKIKRGGADKLEALRAAAAERAGMSKDHADVRVVEPLMVPLMIVAARYDEFMDVESVRRKPLLCAMRYIAHVHGASLLCVSRRDKTQLSHFRALLNHYVFRTDRKRTAQTDPARPLMVPAGCDSLEAIGAPPGASLGDVMEGPIQARVAPWRKAVEAYFPRDRSGDAEDAKAGEDEAQRWMEPSVDAMRAQKSEELERYVKEAERKLRLEASKKR